MRSVRSEIASVLTVLAVPVLIACALPYEALRFRASETPPRRTFVAAIVRLSPQAELQAMKTAKTSWRGSDGARSLRADLFVAELPDDEGSRPVMSAGERARLPDPPVADCGWTPFLPSRKAPPPRKIAPDAAADAGLTFSREELLKID